LLVSDIMDELLVTIEPTFPDSQMLQSQIHASSSLAVIETSFLTFGECACDQFHFLIPLHNAPAIRTESKLYSLREMMVFPCNPMQAHRVEDTGIVDFKALVLYMEKTLFQSVAEEMFGHGCLELYNDCFVFSPAIKELVYAFINECHTEQPGCSLMLESLSMQTAIVLLRECHHNLSFSSLKPAVHKDNKCINRAIDYIMDNYQNKMSLRDLASETHYSPYHFSRLFKQHTGRTPFEFLLEIRIEKAKTLLKHTDHSISEICYLSGFSNHSYFSQIFKKKTGVSPSQYKFSI